MRSWFAAAAALTFLLSGTTASGCELHVWPAARSLAVVEYNVWHMGRDRAFVGSGGGRPSPNLLSPRQQIAVLQQISLASLLGLPTGSNVVYHEEPISRFEASQPVRRARSTTNCHAELLVTSIAYESAVHVARSLRLTISFRKFEGAGVTPIQRFTTSTKAKLTIFPARREEEIGIANADLDSAYRNAVTAFAEFASRSASQRP